MRARLRSFLHTLRRRDEFDAALDAEMRSHLEHHIDDLVRAGMPPAEAARRARIDFGSLYNTRLDSRHARGLEVLDGASRELRGAYRRLRHTPGFTAGVVATLAICLGSTLSILAVVDSVLLRPLPFPQPDRLVAVYNTYPKADVPNDGCSVANYYERRSRIAGFSDVAVYRHAAAIVGDPGATAREAVTRVSPDFFATLGVTPALGRVFTDGETSYETNRVAILTDAFWRRALNADPQAIGRAIRIDGAAFVVVGILPREFSFLSSRAVVYLPLASTAEERSSIRRHWGSAQMIARLRPAVSLEQAQDEIDAHNAALEAGHPMAARMADAGFRSMVVPLHGDHVASVQGILWLLMSGVLVLLLIGAVNVINLFLIRASGRSKELAVRQALGASRRHVVVETLVETLAIVAMGAAAAVLMGSWGIELLQRLGTEHLPLGSRLAFNARLLWWSLALAAALGALVAVPTIWFHLRAGGLGTWRAEPRGATSSRAVQQLRHGFVVAQIALAFVLLAGASLVSASLREVMAVFPGFRPDNILTGQMTLLRTTYPDGASLTGFADRLSEELTRQPGVIAAGVATNIPLSGTSNKSAVTVRGHALRPGQSPQGHYSYSVGGDYFAVMGYSIREGRFLDKSDARATERSCVVDQAFAERYFPGRSALGQEVFQGAEQLGPADTFRIVGVVGAVKQGAITDSDAQGAVYFPFVHRLDRNIFVVMRTSQPVDELAHTLRATVRAIDPDSPVTDVRSMHARIDDSLVARRSPALLAAAFSAVALLLAAIGTYGAIACSVAERRREISLRLALGASPHAVRRHFFATVLRLLAIALALGVGGAWLAGHSIEALLFRVSATDWRLLTAAAGSIAIVGLVACVAPVYRASRIPPLEALND